MHGLHLRRDRVDARLRFPVAVAEEDNEENDRDGRDDADRDTCDPARVVRAHPEDRDEECDEAVMREGQTSKA